jgi:hypothetical protein
LAARRGKKRAAVAVGHSILVIACHLLNDRVANHYLGPDYFDQHDRGRVAKWLIERLLDLRYRVTAEPLTTAA